MVCVCVRFVWLELHRVFPFCVLSRIFCNANEGQPKAWLSLSLLMSNSILSPFICAGSYQAKLPTVEKAAVVGLCITKPPQRLAFGACVCADSGLQQSARLCVDPAHWPMLSFLSTAVKPRPPDACTHARTRFQNSRIHKNLNGWDRGWIKPCCTNLFLLFLCSLLPSWSFFIFIFSFASFFFFFDFPILQKSEQQCCCQLNRVASVCCSLPEAWNVFSERFASLRRINPTLTTDYAQNTN